MCLRKEDHRAKVPSTSSCQGYILSVWLVSIDVSLDHLAETVFVRWLLCKVISPSFLWKEVTACSSHLRRAESYATTLKAELPTYVIWDANAKIFLFSLTYWFNHLFTSVWNHFILWVIVYISFYTWVVIYHYFTFVAQIVPALATGSSCSWLLCPLDVLPLVWVFSFFFLISYELFLFSRPIRCSRLNSYVSFPRPGISHFSKDL